MFATPLSSAMICCVRRAIITASSVGSANVSSSELVWSDCVPPRTAASACRATRTTLLYGCCAVSETPAVCACVRSFIDSARRAPKRSFMSRAQSLRAARNLAISSKKSLCTSKKNERRGAKSSTSRPRARQLSTYPTPSARVNASSCPAVLPASRMW